MNTDKNDRTDILMTDVSMFGRSYEQVHGIGAKRRNMARVICARTNISVSKVSPRTFLIRCGGNRCRVDAEIFGRKFPSGE